MSAIAVIETVSNQSFIFGTNRLREIVGASEMIYACGVDLVLKALKYSEKEIASAREAGGLAACEKGKKDFNDIDILLVTSGKAILAGERAKLEEIITKVTRRALEEKLGVTVRGGIAEWDDENSAKSLHKAIRKAHERLAELRHALPSNDLRFQRLPVVDECASSGLPAWGVDGTAPDLAMRIVSEPVHAKRDHRDKGWERLTGWLGGKKYFAGNIDDLEEAMQGRDARWIAVIHADGNGLGQIFLDFLDRVNTEDANDYIEKYRAFSLALEECTLGAVRDALKRVKWRRVKAVIPFIPLVLGGDDLTAICTGDAAVAFTHAFLEAFEKQTRENDGIKAIQQGGLTAGAGIAIVKPHFPFHRAYELAEALAGSAKKEKKISRLRYHVHFDSSGADWDRIKKQLEVKRGGEKVRLSMQPWVVTPGKGKGGARDISRLWEGIDALSATNADGRPLLPRSQQHALRDGLFAGKAIADARLRRIRHRYAGFNWEAIGVHDDSLFVDPEGHTPLLDMMDLADVGAKPPTNEDEDTGQEQTSEAAA